MFIFLLHDLSVTWCGYDRPDYTALIYNNNNKVPSTLLSEVQDPIFITVLFLKTIESVFCVSNTFCFLIIHLFNFCAKFQNPNIQRGWKLFSVWAPQSTIAQIQVLRRTDQSTKDYLSIQIATLENRYIGLRIQESLLQPLPISSSSVHSTKWQNNLSKAKDQTETASIKR